MSFLLDKEFQNKTKRPRFAQPPHSFMVISLLYYFKSHHIESKQSSQLPHIVAHIFILFIPGIYNGWGEAKTTVFIHPEDSGYNNLLRPNFSFFFRKNETRLLNNSWALSVCHHLSI